MRNKIIPRINLKKYIVYDLINKIITKRAIQNRIEIHIGDNTHNHDHVATAVVPVNFNTINTIVSNPTKPIPDDEDDELFPIILFVYMFLQFVDFQLLQFFH